MEDCLFCKIIKGEIPAYKVYEDDTVYAFLDINPNNLGHTLVIPKAHYQTYSETPDEVLADLMVKAKKIGQAVIKAMDVPAYNVSVNVGKEAGQLIFHTHVHIIPRFEGDGHKHFGHVEYKEGEAEKVAEKISQNL